jgi:sec-independent protein translocase protein TatB
MFDIGASELLLIVVVAIVVIGPKDLPLALRTAGRWMGKIRRVSGHFRSGIETMIREAELEEMERKWREQNEAIMKASAQEPSAASAEAGALAPPEYATSAEPDAKQALQLPLPPP